MVERTKNIRQLQQRIKEKVDIIHGKYIALRRSNKTKYDTIEEKDSIIQQTDDILQQYEQRQAN